MDETVITSAKLENPDELLTFLHKVFVEDHKKFGTACPTLEDQDGREIVGVALLDDGCGGQIVRLFHSDDEFAETCPDDE